MPEMTGAHYLATTLDRGGVSHVFVVPTIISETLVAMEEHTAIKRIVPHSEKGAAYMADGYARATGSIGVCGAQNVGRANLAAGLQDAYLGCSPVLAITGNPEPHSATSRRFYQEIDAFQMFEPVTKSSVQLTDVTHLPDVLRQAIRTATTGKPGPVHIGFTGHAGEKIEHAVADLDDAVDERFMTVPPFRPAPPEGAVELAMAQLAKAERPVIVAGGGVRLSGAAAELVALAERLQVPVATSLNAKDIIPGDHPLSLGVVGLYCRKSANRAVWESDLVVYVGSQTSSQVTFNWQVPPRSTPVIHVDIEAEELGRHYAHTTPVLGDAKVVLTQMLAAAGTAPDRSGWVAEVQTYREEYFEEFASVMSSDADPMRPERLCRELTDLLPEDALLVTDTGHAGMWTGGMVDLLHREQGFLRAAGSLGWGLPAAIGAKMGSPDRPVMVFTGDGGLWYHATEIETAVRWKVPLVILVNNNRSMNQEINPFRRAYGGSLRGRHEELWHFTDLDLTAVAESMGATGVRVTRPSELRSALDMAFASSGPVVVDVVTDIDALAPLGYLPQAS